MNLEYKINQGELIEFETEITRYHFKRIQSRRNQGTEAIHQMRKKIIEKYNLNEDEFANNYKTHYNRICN